mmetsp:Transcript_6303/g.10238  ORF Transcript_6303/g.10238 Transcript_6303/m.10238 type:complete len:110 (-) Transcript_6303:682-1011(-)|eukprot:CAMPEP_0170512464 /NCGR_PEP_ID=MMETSP0208-20121228/66865_1 /TAXON_ID=197538 /ORGANISM="Strombidium inclinatum, Strain S3" /LENGTH=109 /DNA_ID=CAMNT_0010796097 /DNA_START=511 /DNA_END=840 /DNA_ORIENTATION=+
MKTYPAFVETFKEVLNSSTAGEAKDKLDFEVTGTFSLNDFLTVHRANPQLFEEISVHGDTPKKEVEELGEELNEEAAPAKSLSERMYDQFNVFFPDRKFEFIRIIFRKL